MKKILTIFWAILGVVLLIALYVLLAKPFAKRNSRFQNDIKQEYMIQDARVRVSSYEWFYDQYNAIKSQKNKIKVISDATEKQAAELILFDMIGEYNSRASMSMTKAQWKPRDLPYEILED